MCVCKSQREMRAQRSLLCLVATKTKIQELREQSCARSTHTAPRGQTSASHSLQLATRVNAPEGQASRPLTPLARKEIRFKVNLQALCKLQKNNLKLVIIILTIIITERFLVQLAKK